MSDIRKWLSIMESVPATLLNQRPKNVVIKKDATIMVDPSIGGGTGRYMHSTPQGAMIDIKGVSREMGEDDFSLPNRDYEDPYENGNTWDHGSEEAATIGTMRDKPEFRAGDMVEVADVYGSVIGPGFGIFIAYSTSGQECIISFDNKEILVPIANVGAVQEQNAKDNFSQTDNDGNLSPMSLGSKNVKIDKEPAMDQRDEFSKWMSAVEEALSGESKPLAEESEPENECGCGEWNCTTCFPDHKAQEKDKGKSFAKGIESSKNDINADDLAEEKPKSKGVKLGDIVQTTKTEFRKEGGGDKSPMTYGEENLGTMDEEVPGMDVQQPLFGEEEAEMEENWYDPSQDQEEFNNPQEFGMDSGNESGEESDWISIIKNMQQQGLSNANQSYSDEEMAGMSSDELRYVYQQVTGDVAEATQGMDAPGAPKPTKPKFKPAYDPMDDMDDILNPRPDQPLATMGGSDDDENELAGNEPGMTLPSAGRDATRAKLANMNPSDQMRDWMSRISPTAGEGEPDREEVPQNQLVARTANDVPAVIASAIQASGMQSPEWHDAGDLPGMADRNIRGMARQVMSMFTSTPLEQIQTIANVGGQGPNTDAEMRAVAGWLRDNAEDHGKVDLSHGIKIPGYKPDVKEYSANGVRFHVVRDDHGQYIYAYPDRDARLGGPVGREQGRVGGGGNMPRLRESTGNIFDSLSLIESLKFDEEIAEILREDSEMDEAFGKPNHAERKARTIAGHAKRSQDAFNAGEELPADLPPEKSQLSRVVGKRPGGMKLIKHLHATEKLSNEAELEPIPVTTGKDAAQLAWAQFNNNPDDFVIVSGQGGVAGIKPNKASVEKFKATAAKKGKEPNYSKHAGAIRYDVIAYTGEGSKVPTNLLQPAGAAQDDADDLDDYQDADQGAGEPKVKAIKARMGLVHGQDRQNPDNVFNLLNAQIGPITTVWIAGWAGNRGGDTGTMPASPGAVERGKMKGRADLAGQVGKPEKLAFPDRQSEMPAQADTGTISRALDVIFKKSLTSDRVKRMIGSAVEKLIGAERKAQQGGLRDKAVEIGQRILKLEDIQKMALRGEAMDPGTMSGFKRTAERIARSTVDAEHPGLDSKKKELEVVKYLSSLAKSGSPDLYKPFIRALMNTLSKEGLRNY